MIRATVPATPQPEGQAKPEETKPAKPFDAEWCTIHRAIPQITGAVSPISKNRENKSQGYSFRGVDDVYAVLNLLLEKYGVSVVPEVLEAHRESYQSKAGGTMFKTILRVRYHLIASDGSKVESVVEGEGMDSGDKSTQKALSMAYKYMAFQVFCIPTGEKIDTENDSPQVVGAAQSASAAQKALPPKALPPSLWQRVKEVAEGYQFPCGANDADLKAVVKATTGKLKPGDLTEEDFKKIEAALAAAVTKQDEDIPF